MYTNQTGAFPVTCKKGNKYIMILCKIDNNVIMSEAMQNRSSGKIVRTYLVLMQQIKAAEIRPNNHVLDNECSTEFKKAIKEQYLEHELVPNGQHRRNLAERALQTWKAHTIGSIRGVADTFLLGLWDEILPQLDMQVNILRFSNIHPKVYSWTVLNGAHNFNRHPLAPLGVEIQMLENPDKRKTWGVRINTGYYVGTSLEHYRHYWGCMKETKKIRVSDTVSFKHKNITNISITTGDAIVNAAHKLTSALRGSIPPPLVKSGIGHMIVLTDSFNATKEGYDEREEINPPRQQRTHQGCPRVVHLRGWPKIKISPISSLQIPVTVTTREKPKMKTSLPQLATHVPKAPV